jgi:hypothetical protein
MNLFHAFPRPRGLADVDAGLKPGGWTQEDLEKGLEILRLILTHGLLCTPEKFKLYPNYKTENRYKRNFVTTGEPHDRIVQSRGCFSLVDTPGLSKEYELMLSGKVRYAAHSDLFGPFAIGVNPLEAREFGAMPTVYYYRHDLGPAGLRTAGLGSQIIERLDELRGILTVLSYVEGIAKRGTSDEEYFPPADRLKRMDIKIRYQDEIEADLERLGGVAANRIFDLFNTDRVPAWNLLDFVEIMLSLYQTTDSAKEDAPLSYFNQREWRVVHHRMAGLVWYGLNDHPDERDPFAKRFGYAIDDIRESIFEFNREKSEEFVDWYLDHCWVLAGTENAHFRDFVRQIVVPEVVYHRAQGIVNSLPFSGPRPNVVPLPAKWRILTEEGTPRIIYSELH